MIVLWIIFYILLTFVLFITAAILLFSALKYKLEAVVTENNVSLRLKVLCFQLKLTNETAKKKPSKKKNQKEKPPISPPVEKTKSAKKAKPNLLKKLTDNYNVSVIKELLVKLLAKLKKFMFSIKIDKLHISYIFASDDPAKTGVQFGNIYGAASALEPLFDSIVKIKDERFYLGCDFARTTPYYAADIVVSIMGYRVLLLIIGITAVILPKLIKKKG